MTSGSTETCPLPAESCTLVGSGSRPRWEAIARRGFDYVQLTKPRILSMALLAVTAGYALGSGVDFRLTRLLHALLGIGLVAAAAGTLNQYAERRTDGRMRRTASRPLPAKRLRPRPALVFGSLLAVLGLGHLLVHVNGLTAALSAFTLVAYLGVYTPMKRMTALCTAVGAIPGAMPPVLGWVAAGGSLDTAALSLFGILYLWQFPHFLAIGWLYRHDYARAGLRMLPALSVTNSVASSASFSELKCPEEAFTDARPWAAQMTGLLSVLGAGGLFAVSLLPWLSGFATAAYAPIAIFLSATYFGFAWRFAKWRSRRSARHLLWCSLAYLPLLLASLVVSHFWPLAT
ncbi:MAG: protoheme IX farnesyltransferase [Planctomycetes bacterium]|nr:protoheme IX farnesyltransferase [Planctomycetota bacterium]